jgi:hypothetical protein
MKQVFIAMGLLLSLGAYAQSNIPVCFSFNGYKGVYYLDSVKPSTEHFGTLQDTTYTFTPGEHHFYVDGEVASDMKFNVSTTGAVNITTNTDAATVSYTTTPNNTKVAKITFNTATITIKSCGAAYFICSDRAPYPHFQTGNTNKFTLIKGLSYLMATGFSCASVPVTTIPGRETITYFPENFYIHIDSLGNVHPQDATVAGDNFAAKYKGNVMVFNTAKITINPIDYNATELKIDGLGSFKSKATVRLIKGVGTVIKYRSNQQDYYKMHLIVPY